MLIHINLFCPSYQRMQHRRATGKIEKYYQLHAKVRLSRYPKWDCQRFHAWSIIFQAYNRDPLLLGCKERFPANQGSDGSGWLCGVGGSLWLHCQDPLSDSPTKYKNFGAGLYNWPEELWKLSSHRWQSLLWGRFTRDGNQGRISN